MYSVTVKNIPADIYKSLKQLANANRRSMNEEIIAIIEEAIKSKKNVSEEFLKRARQLREKPANCPITDDEFTAAKKAGRR